MKNQYAWAEQMNCAVTVSNAEGIIIYMNEKSRNTFAKYGDLIGKRLLDCHPTERARTMIQHLMETGGTNSYTIDKNGIKKMIYQTAWRENGKVAGLVEISMEIPQEMPHYIRQ